VFDLAFEGIIVVDFQAALRDISEVVKIIKSFGSASGGRGGIHHEPKEL
jgi:hypothetical protein